MRSIEAILFEPAGCLAESLSEPAYEDVKPALVELKSMGVRLILVSSPREAAMAFLETNGLLDFFEAIWSVKPSPDVLSGASLTPDRTMYLTDNAEGLKVAKRGGLQSVLMMNDPDEAKRLALQNPTGGIVSLLELPDFIRLVAANRGSCL